MTPQPFEELREEWNKIELADFDDEGQIFYASNNREGFKKDINLQADWWLSRFHQKLLSLKESMEGKKISESVIESYDETNSRDEAMDKGNSMGYNQGIDTAISLLGIDNQEKR